MLRAVLTTIGLIELISPQLFITVAERLALENPDECEMKSWITPVARVEGAVFLVLMWRSDTSYSTFKRFLGVIGFPALLYPRIFTDYGARLAYTEATDCEWRPWVYAATRLVGVLYVIVSFNELRKRSR